MLSKNKMAQKEKDDGKILHTQKIPVHIIVNRVQK